jgi:hypothetical protein
MRAPTCLALQDSVHLAFYRSFRRIGIAVSRRPRMTVCAALVAVLACACGMLRGTWEARLEYSYLPRSLRAFKEFERQRELFGQRPRVEEFKLDRLDGGNMLEEAFLRRAKEYHNSIERLTATVPNGMAVTYADICERVYDDGPCAIDNVFSSTELWASLYGMSKQELNRFFYERRNDLDRYVGGLRVDKGRKSATATSLRFFYLVAPVDDSPTAFTRFGADPLRVQTLAWEAAFINATNVADDGQGLYVQGVAGRSLDDEIARNVQGSIVFMALAILSILLYMAVLLGGAPPRDSRLLLGAGAVLTILLAEIAGFGLSALFGVPLTDLSLLIVFIVVGVGVDDVIIVVGERDCVRPTAACPPTPPRRDGSPPTP